MNSKYTKDIIEKAVKDSKSWADVCRKFGVKPATGTQSHLTLSAKKFGVDTSHFTGQGWSKGKKFPPKRPITDYLVENSTVKSSALRNKLISNRIKEYKCELCGLAEWRGEKIPLELDHKNSNHWDNRLENLQVICPNCHAQETTRRCTPFGERTVLGTVEAKAIAGSIPVTGTKFCATCNKSISKRANRCKSCSARDRKTKIKWPDREELLRALSISSYSMVSKQLGVSDNAIRKHLRTSTS